MLIRAAQLPDTPAWLRMREALWPSAPGEHAGEIAAYFAGALKNPLEVLLAFDTQGEAVGMIELSVRNYAEGCLSDRVAYVEGWYVAPDYRRSGVGGALMHAAEDWARARGCSELASDTEVDNERSAQAHRALGFTETGVIRCFMKSLDSQRPSP